GLCVVAQLASPGADSRSVGQIALFACSCNEETSKWSRPAHERGPIRSWLQSNNDLFFEVILNRSYDSNRFHQAGIGAGKAATYPNFFKSFFGIRRKNGEDALICLANRTNLTTGVQGKAVCCGTGIPRSLSNHVRLDGI